MQSLYERIQKNCRATAQRSVGSVSRRSNSSKSTPLGELWLAMVNSIYLEIGSADEWHSLKGMASSGNGGVVSASPQLQAC